jgi:large subunit ribosomal protein L3
MKLEGLIGKKIEMSQIYDSNGDIVPVTILEVGPCIVTQIKDKEKDGYEVCQLGFGHQKPVLLKKPQAGHFKNTRQKPRFLREMRVLDGSSNELKIGQEIKLDQVFTVGEKIEVTGKSKGKGFQGGVKRWGFHGGPKTHGQSDRWRAPGSIGSTTSPGRVLRGKRMAGHMGDEIVTVKNLKIFNIDTEKNLLVVKIGRAHV